MVQQRVGQFCFNFIPGLPVIVESKNVQVSSDAGILPIKQFDDQIGLTERFITCLNDPRDPDLTRHHVDEMVRQRIFGILAGYEDCYDHDTLRGDPIFKRVSGRTPNDDDLASQPTLSRFENAVDIPSLWRLHDFFLDDFIGSFDTPPGRITLEFDATDDPCHGQQQLVLFHGFYEQYQYLPLICSCAETQRLKSFGPPCGRERCMPPWGRTMTCVTSSPVCGPLGPTWRFMCAVTPASGFLGCTPSAKNWT